MSKHWSNNGLIYYEIQDADLNRVYYENGVYAGDLFVNDDGFWVWWPDKELDGYLSEEVLEAIRETLHYLNRNWRNQIHKDLS